MLLAEDLLLLLSDRRTGKQRKPGLTPLAVGGALLEELRIGAYVSLGPRESRLERRRVQASLSRRPSEPVLAECLRVVGERQRTPTRVVAVLARSVGQHLGSGRPHDPSRRDRLVTGLQRSLRDDATADPRTAALAGLLWSVGLVGPTVRPAGVSRRTANRRASAMTDQDWVVRATRRAVLNRQNLWASVGSLIPLPWSG